MSLDQPLPPPGPPSAVPAISPAAGAEPLRLSWSHPPGMVALSFKNFFLRIVTLGIYHFWGKTEVRRRIWSGVRINGEPLQYTGTGKEMFLGFLVVMAVVTIPTFLLAIASALIFGEKNPMVDAGANALMTLGFFYLIGVGMHRAVRYRMSRTTWRGIRGGLEGNSWSYGWTYFWTGPGLFMLVASTWISIVSFRGWMVQAHLQPDGLRSMMLNLAIGAGVIAAVVSWIMPWRAVKLQSLITNGLRFGNRQFSFSATAGPLYRPFFALWFSVIAIVLLVGLLMWLAIRDAPGGLEMFSPGRKVDPAVLFRLVLILYAGFFLGFLLFAMVSAWYRARMMNHFAAHTSFEGARFHGTATGRSLIGLAVSNMLIVLFTLGLLAPVAQARSARYFVQRLQIEGTASLAQILQRAEEQGRGEGLAQAFDIDAF